MASAKEMDRSAYNLVVDLYHTCGYEGEVCVRVMMQGPRMPVICPGCTEIVTRVSLDRDERNRPAIQVSDGKVRRVRLED